MSSTLEPLLMQYVILILGKGGVENGNASRAEEERCCRVSKHSIPRQKKGGGCLPIILKFFLEKVLKTQGENTHVDNEIR